MQYIIIMPPYIVYCGGGGYDGSVKKVSDGDTNLN